MLLDQKTELIFSPVNIGEIAIKRGLGRSDFQTDPRLLYRGLFNNGHRELSVTSEHAFAVESSPLLHRDPFDRILIAQAMVEGVTLLTANEKVAQYPGSVRRVE